MASVSVGDGRPRGYEDTERGRCGSHFDGLVYCVNADYRKTTCPAFHFHRVVLLGRAIFKASHFKHDAVF